MGAHITQPRIEQARENNYDDDWSRVKNIKNVKRFRLSRALRLILTTQSTNKKLNSDLTSVVWMVA